MLTKKPLLAECRASNYSGGETTDNYPKLTSHIQTYVTGRVLERLLTALKNKWATQYNCTASSALNTSY